MGNNSIVRKHIIFYGYVQGVGFRYRARHAADLYGCTGWVSNEWDGSVSMEIQGEESQIDQVILAIERGTYVRIDMSGDKYRPREIKEFAQSFNKTAEELSGTEILRKDFINNFSHEFKTPIVSINGFAELLLEENLSYEDQKEFLGIIRDESRRLAELSTTILTLSRIESQAILRDRETFRLDGMLLNSHRREYRMIL